MGNSKIPCCLPLEDKDEVVILKFRKNFVSSRPLMMDSAPFYSAMLCTMPFFVLVLSSLSFTSLVFVLEPSDSPHVFDEYMEDHSLMSHNQSYVREICTRKLAKLTRKDTLKVECERHCKVCF